MANRENMANREERQGKNGERIGEVCVDRKRRGVNDKGKIAWKPV